MFDNCSIVVLIGENYKLLLSEAKKIADIYAGPKADDELRIHRYFNKEIIGKRDEIISSLKTKSFFPGRQVIILNSLDERDYKIITEIDLEWRDQDALTIVTLNGLSKGSELKNLMNSSTRIAFVHYTKNKINNEFLTSKLSDENINFEGQEVLDTLIEFANFTSEDILENELEKLKLFKLFDDKPLSVEDFLNVVSVNYEVNELNLAVALAERNIKVLEGNLSGFFLRGTNPISILQFISAYFYKLYLIKLYGPTSFEARREYPFLIAKDLEKAKIHLKRWSLDQLSHATNSLTISDLKLRKYPSVFHRPLLTQCLHKIMEI